MRNSEQGTSSSVSPCTSVSAFPRRGLLAALAGGVAGLPLPGFGQVIAPADTSRAAREQALRRIPLRQLTPSARRRVAAIVDRPTLYRRMPTEQFRCDPDLFLFMIRYPEVVVNMWELMGVTKIRIRRVADYVMDADDGSGTLTRVELMYGNRNTHLMFAEGEYSGPLFRRRLKGQCVMLLTSDYPDGQNVVTSEMDVFLTLDNMGADFVARTLHPVVGRTADHNYSESARFLSQVSEQAAANPGGMSRLADRLQNVEASIRRRFTDVVAQVAQRSGAEAGQDLTAQRRPSGPNAPVEAPVRPTTTARAPNRRSRRYRR